jgi:hypothetical protein
VDVSSEDVSQTIEARQAVELTGQDRIEVSSIPRPDSDSFDRWSRERDQRLEASISARYVNPGIPGNADLDDSGRWQDVSEYGPVWLLWPPTGVLAQS